MIASLDPKKAGPASRRLQSHEWLALVLAGLTALILANREELTSVSLSLRPGHEGSAFLSYAYSDQAGGGGSSAVTAAPGRPLTWQCILARSDEHAHCGFGLLFDTKNTGRGLDLERYRQARIRIHYEGPGRSVRLILKNKDQRYAAIGALSDEKISSAGLAIVPGEQTIIMDLDRLAVAEWWRDAAQLPAAELVHPDFDNVVAMEILTGVEAAPGEHRITLREITYVGEVVGAGVLYAVCAAAWTLLVGLILINGRANRLKWEREVAERLNKTVDTIPQMVWSVGRRGSLHVNRRWLEFTGQQPGGESCAKWWRVVHPSDRAAVMGAWRKAASGSETDYRIEFRIRHRSGEYRWVVARATAEIDGQGIAGWYGTCTDVNDRVLAEAALRDSVAAERRRSEELRWVGEHDSLTGLPNRVKFNAHLEDSLARDRALGTKTALLLLDVDHFKAVNDTYGHATGDDLLRAFSQRVRGLLRPQDFFARLGGDEFAIVIDVTGNEQALAGAARAISVHMKAPFKLGGRTVSVGASMGGCVFPQHGTSAKELLNNADTALYALKGAGRGGFKLYEEELGRQAQDVASQLRLARLSVSDGTIMPFYQPKVDLVTKEVVGLEALLRWQRPDSGIQSPGSVSEAFKDYELASRIGALMQSKVLADLQSWQKAGLEFGRVSINAAPVEFLRNDYAELVLDQLVVAGVSPRCIEVEITEQVFHEREVSFVRRALGKLADAGVTIALDDFGTGHSSLSNLRDFPVSVLKFDRSFIRGIATEAQDFSIVSAIASLGRTLGMEVVAEGIETVQDESAALRAGCSIGQGHLFGKAVSAAETRLLLIRHSRARAA